MPNPIVGIYSPAGNLIPETVCESRKVARRSFAEKHGCKWNALWQLGYKVRSVERKP